MTTDKNYPTWLVVEKELRLFWKENYQREKIITLKESEAPNGNKLEFGSEHVPSRTTIQPIPHVYYYAEVTTSKPTGSEFWYKMRIAYYQSGSEWAFHYASPYESKETKKSTNEDPMKLTPEMALKIYKNYIDLMMKKHFPNVTWKEYCKENSVMIKITKISFKDTIEMVKKEIAMHRNDSDESFREAIIVEGEYKDKMGSFKFKIENIFMDLYMNVRQGFWSLDRNGVVLEELDVNASRDLRDKLFATSTEPKKALEEYAIEPS